MRVSCPNCQTEYDVPDAALAGRTRKLRCAHCETQWVAGPLPEPPAAEPPLPPPPPVSAPPDPPPTEQWARPVASTPYKPATTSVTDNMRPFPEPAFANPYAPPPRPTEPDPQEARNIADRESFAALLESSRQASAQEPEETETTSRKRRPSPWLISILVLLLIIGLIFIERTNIMAAWPPSIRLFQALGLSK
jgi:predicted Zn finger-like uncharacterized protein